MSILVNLDKHRGCRQGLNPTFDIFQNLGSKAGIDRFVLRRVRIFLDKRMV